MTERVIVGMSGGVDSSVTALLCLEKGYEVEGLFMKNWDEDDGTEYCTAKEDLADAQSVCDRLGITLHTANFSSEYWDNVFEHFLDEYRDGRTPNPDVLCNKEIKFKAFLDYATGLGGDYIATGHYTRKLSRNGDTFLRKGFDPNKDQSYFLHAVSESAFSKTLFPIGELEKSDVRAIAKENGLITHGKKDSTGICFIGERRFKDFLQKFLPAQPGDIISEDGRKLGEHNGLMYHTIGQRQGLGIGGVNGAQEAAWYVAKKNLENNVLTVVQGGNNPLLFAKGLEASQLHWINGRPLENTFMCFAKTRYRQQDQECTVFLGQGNRAKVVFTDPQRAITPGQSVVFYRDDICLGGGIIENAA